MLQSTLGNLPELFVVIFALQKGELVVAQTAIVGSILANALLVLGLVIVVGARRSPDGVMRFSQRLPRDTATLLQVTVFIIVLLGLSLGLPRPRQPPRARRSRRSARSACWSSTSPGSCPTCARTSAPGPTSDGGAGRERRRAAPAAPREPRLSLRLTLALLVLGGAPSAFVSDWFVNGAGAGDRACCTSRRRSPAW